MITPGQTLHQVSGNFALEESISLSHITLLVDRVRPKTVQVTGTRRRIIPLKEIENLEMVEGMARHSVVITCTPEQLEEAKAKLTAHIKQQAADFASEMQRKAAQLSKQAEQLTVDQFRFRET